MITLTVLTAKPESPFYVQLSGIVDEQILHLQDARGKFLLDKVHESNMNYYFRNAAEKPWNNHLLLSILVYADHNADVRTISRFSSTIHPRLIDIFGVFKFKKMSEFEVEIHMYDYLKGSYYQEHSDSKRKELLNSYTAVCYKKKKWITTKLNSAQQSYFEQFLFPMPSYDSSDFSFSKSAKEQSQNTRKSETDVIVPLLPQIRAEGHFRWNQINRLRQAFVCFESPRTLHCFIVEISLQMYWCLFRGKQSIPC
ncbi:hypothetical protein [Bacillus sp. NPDC094106]|uniref:hypothetical protein n=1 Tax=Bacillus sp. NPDC094106 TaxID=3363949 RepID=UPI0037FFD44F